MRRLVIGVVIIVLISIAMVAGAQTAEEWVDKGCGTTDLELKVEYCTRAIELDPEYARAYNNRGWAYYLMGDNTRALEDANTALKLEPNYEYALDTRGNIYRSLGKLDNAKADLERSIEINPDYYWAYYSRGLLYIELGEMENARADFEYACENGVNMACDLLEELGK